MRFWIRILSVVLALAAIMTIGGCANAAWGAKSDNDSVPPGLYILGVIYAFNEAYTHDLDTAQRLDKQEIEGINAYDWVLAETEDYVEEYFAVNAIFAEKGLSFTENEIDAYKLECDNQWVTEKDFFEYNGVSKSSLELTFESSAKRTKIFNYFYSSEGEFGLSEADFITMLNTEYGLAKMVSPSFEPYVSTGNEAEDAQQARAEAQSYYDRIRAGENIDVVIIDFQKKLYEAFELDTSALVVPEDPDTMLDVISRKDAYSPEFEKSFWSAPFNEPFMFEDDVRIYVGLRYDFNARPDLVEEVREGVLWEQHGDAFTQILEDKYTTQNITFNSGIVNQFTPAKMKLEQQSGYGGY